MVCNKMRSYVAFGTTFAMGICGAVYTQASANSIGLEPPQSGVTGWAVGGGEIRGDAINPWFIQNTKVISYCIESVPEFGAGKFGEPEQLDWLIAQAFDYWKKEFVGIYSKIAEIRVGTQNLNRQASCDDLTDIRFQFGFLTDYQINSLKRQGLDPVKNVALSVRTGYSKKEMKGKGFVYLAPRKGDLKPEGKFSPPWNTSMNAIFTTLVHEIGHIYGVPHNSNPLDVMFEGQGESLVQTDPAKSRTDGIGFLLSHFGYKNPFNSFIEYRLCLMNEETREFYGLSSDAKGIGWKADGSDKILIYEIGCSDGGLKEERLVGKIKVEKSSEEFRLLLSGIRAWLPKEQTVVPRRDGDSQARYGLFPAIRSFRANYLSESGQVARSLHLETVPSSGVLNLYSFMGEKVVFGPGLFIATPPKAN